MHIKDSPVKGYKTDFAGFELDITAIELHSSDKHSICLPYSGPLPDALQKNDGAYITVNITVRLGIYFCLAVKMDNKKHHYSVEATPHEINNLLFAFFFVDKGHNAFHTKWDCGLTRYYLGHYQSAYTTWRRFVVEGHGIEGVIDQLPTKALDWLEKYIEYKKTA